MYVQRKNTDFVGVKFTFVTSEGFLVYSSSGKNYRPLKIFRPSNY